MNVITDDKPIGSKRRITISVIWAVLAAAGWQLLVMLVYIATFFTMDHVGLMSDWLLWTLKGVTYIVMLGGMIVVGRYAYREKMYGPPPKPQKQSYGFEVLNTGIQADQERNQRD